MPEIQIASITEILQHLDEIDRLVGTGERLDSYEEHWLRAQLRAVLSDTRITVPDHCYDPENWEVSYGWEDRDELFEAYPSMLHIGEVKEIATLIDGPSKWAARVPIKDSDDEDEIQWFDTEEDAIAVIATGSVST